MKKYQIWIGYYHLGQGFDSPIEPQQIDTVEAVDFKTACMLHELRSRLKRFEEGQLKGDLNSQDYPWWFNEHTISNSWLGKYFETKEEAQQSFS